MTILEQVAAGLGSGREKFDRIMQELEYSSSDMADDASALSLSDNVDFLKQLISEGYSGRFRCIYIDPPFFTRSKFNASVSVKAEDGSSHRIRHLAFDDRFERSLECYVENMTVRILLMKELLAPDGTLWVHLDWHSSHYIRLVLDELLGDRNFVNEIVWCYKSGGSGKKHFSRKHDTILVYSRSRKYYISIPEEKSYNRGFKPYNFKGVREYCDENGWYTLVNMKDVWNVDMVGRTSAERNGYATQKPMELMRRIIEAGSEEGDLIGDFFCGSGSFLEAAQISGRRWMGCDNEKLAVSMARKRLMKRDAAFRSYDLSTEGSAGRIDVTVREEQHLESGGRLIRAAVTDFVPDIDTGYIQTRDRQYIEDAIKDDPQQLIDYIMIDNDFSGEFRCRSIIEAPEEELNVITQGRAAVIAVDVFGREYDGGIL
jgi:site-specific DNA-methyltransferase (adenine-specific)